MIEYSHEEEKLFLLYYASKFDDSGVEVILNRGHVLGSDEADKLSKFFWRMVDQTVVDISQGVMVHGNLDLEAIVEYTFESIRAYLRNNGYEKEWDANI